MSTEKFQSWAHVEIMGHQSYAGLVTEQAIGGSSFVRVDVPEIDGRQAFTKLFGAGSIFCITPVSEDVARRMAATLHNEPVSVWELRQREPAMIGGTQIASEDGNFDDDEPEV